MNKYMGIFVDQGLAVGLKILGAIVLFIAGRWLIGKAGRLTTAAMSRQKMDETLIRYIGSAITVLLNVALIVAILGYFGVETTTFAALLAAIGISIGMAWSGLLSHMAAGVFMVGLRPFKVGDFVTAGGITGTVHEIGLFVTTIDTMDNVRTVIGNNTIFSGTIQNFTANPYRRVELVAQLAHGADHNKAIELLRTKLAEIPNVVTEPGPSVEILEFNLAGPVLAVRPFCHNEHYWDVYFATNAVIRNELGKAGFTVPEQHLRIAQS